MKTFTVEFKFVSERANGDDYFRRLIITARDHASAMVQAKSEGRLIFGSKFLDNCVDWYSVEA